MKKNISNVNLLDEKGMEAFMKSKQDNNTVMEKIEEFEESFEDVGIITDAINAASDNKEQEKIKGNNEFKQRASKKRKEVNQIKQELGIRRSKQSSFPTRSHEFLEDEILSKRGIHVVMTTIGTEIYKDGVDLAPRLLMGRAAYGKKCTLNAFEHLITVQEKIAASRKDKKSKAPAWIIISNDTSIIMDRNLLNRLEELKPTTHAAGTYGFERIRTSGKWYQVDSTNEQKFLRGCYMQGNLNNSNWDFIVGSKFKDSPRYRIMIVHGPFIAVRGETFMAIDFAPAAKHMKKGFYHYMADISMECFKRGLTAAQIKSIAGQYENINDIKDTPDFQHDQAYFTSKWQTLLPASIYPNDNFK